MRGKWRSSHEGPPRRSLSKQLNRAGAGNIPMPEGRGLKSRGGTGIRTDIRAERTRRIRGAGGSPAGAECNVVAEGIGARSAKPRS